MLDVNVKVAQDLFIKAIKDSNDYPFIDIDNTSRLSFFDYTLEEVKELIIEQCRGQSHTLIYKPIEVDKNLLRFLKHSLISLGFEIKEGSNLLIIKW